MNNEFDFFFSLQEHYCRKKFSKRKYVKSAVPLFILSVTIISRKVDQRRCINSQCMRVPTGPKGILLVVLPAALIEISRIVF